MKIPRNHPATIFDLFVALLVFVSVWSVLLLALHHFNPIIAVICGLLSFLLYVKLLTPKITRNGTFGLVIALILLLALLFRARPYFYLVGGWDAGLYMTMASHYEKDGSTFLTDHVRARLDSGQKELYDRYNLFELRDQIHGGLPKKYEGRHHPGIYITNLAKSKYVFQFYPLHPLWMSIFGSFLGDGNGVYSLVFFSLLSLVGFYLLTFEISGGDRFAACLAPFFLAINPAHVYFSKYPVADVVVLAFSSLSFYYLVKYFNEAGLGREPRPVYLFRSAGLMFCLFLTKISGFMYMPFYFVLLVTAALFLPRNGMRTQLLLYFGSVFVLFGVSVIYGLTYSFPYCYDIYGYSFRRVFGNDWEKSLTLFVGSSLLLGFLLIVSRNERLHGAMRNLVSRARGMLPFILYAVILAGVYRAYQVAFTEDFAGFSKRYEWILNMGWASLKYSNLLVVMSYLSPVACVLFLASIYHFGKRKDIITAALFVFLISFWTYGVVIRFATFFQYDWVRYMISELLPYSLLLISLYLGYLRSHKRVSNAIMILVVGLMSVYPLYFTSLHWAREIAVDVGPNGCLEAIAGHVGEGDLLLLCEHDITGPSGENVFDSEIMTPLSYYYGLPIFDIGNQRNLMSRDVIELTCGSGYRDVFLLSGRRIIRDFLATTDSLTYEFHKSAVSETFPPTSFVCSRRNLILYRVDKEILLEKLLNTARILPLHYCPDNLLNFHEGSRWTDGDSSIVGIRYTIKPEDRWLVLNTSGWTPLKDKELDLAVFADGSALKFSHKKANSYYFTLPDLRELMNIRITSATFVARHLGINDDTRALGVHVDSLSIE
ncbi:MAG: hypothetical protein C4532_12065 [Candidatus Abyssobacteria bacterium SURF_17]|uniref:Glycosyltransferase RgtA/B/C/D-like domain-containing protein n=1 Tax=Candidatus Abyssobacteria bacterium SURF_17 TaxID=2093361 RepID=A0A419EW02_9BACT|nr:MAG: hypothetical protein C4532_12065 [Candidatus Abyssubacteria bacterium SURF_17]